MITGSNETNKFMFVVLHIMPGGNISKHSYKEESCYYFLEGSGKVHPGEKTFSAKPGTAVFIPSWEIYVIDNTGKEPMKYIEIKIPD